MQKTFNALFFASTLIMTMEKNRAGTLPRAMYRGDKQHTEEKRRTHQKTFMRKDGKSGDKTCVRRQRLFKD